MVTIANLFHVAIKTSNLDDTVRFYTEVLGPQPVTRPDFGYPSAWFAAHGRTPHYSYLCLSRMLEWTGRAPYGTGAIDHISITVTAHRTFQTAQRGLARIQCPRRPDCGSCLFMTRAVSSLSHF
jgi:catechol 2,3-dioxygenase-like lactoylglutathione lyase family enzyme